MEMQDRLHENQDEVDEPKRLMHVVSREEVVGNQEISWISTLNF